MKVSEGTLEGNGFLERVRVVLYDLRITVGAGRQMAVTVKTGASVIPGSVVLELYGTDNTHESDERREFSLGPRSRPAQAILDSARDSADYLVKAGASAQAELLRSIFKKFEAFAAAIGPNSLELYEATLVPFIAELRKWPKTFEEGESTVRTMTPRLEVVDLIPRAKLEKYLQHVRMMAGMVHTGEYSLEELEGNS